MDRRDQQLRIEFGRGEQRFLLRVVRLPIWTPPAAEEDGRRRDRVSEAAQKATLLAIDSFGRECWASEDSIAAAAGTSLRVCQRAIAALVARSIITRDRRWSPTCGSVRNHYRIVWSEIEQLARVQAASRSNAEDARASEDASASSAARADLDPVPLIAEHPATTADHHATTADHHATMAYKSPTKPEEPPPPSRGRPPAEEEAGFDWRTRDQYATIEVLVDRLESAGLSPLSARRLVRDVPQETIEAALAEYLAHRSLFRSPGAIVVRCREGAWPVAIPAASPAAAEAARSKRIAGRRDAIRAEVLAELRRAGRWPNGASDAEVEFLVNQRIGDQK